MDEVGRSKVKHVGLQDLLLSALSVCLTGQFLDGGVQAGHDGLHFRLMQLQVLLQAAEVGQQVVGGAAVPGQVPSQLTQAPPQLLLLAAAVPPPLDR